MLIHRLLFNRKMDEAGGDGGDGGGNGGTPQFLDQFEGDMRTSLEKSGITDINGLAKQWSDGQSYIGSSIRVPSEEAGEEDRKAFYEKIQKHAPDLMPRPDSENAEAMDALWSQLGRPETADKYNIPEGVQADQVSELMVQAHKAGLTDAQFQGLVQQMAQVEATRLETAKETLQNSQNELKQEWGLAYDQNVQMVANLAKQTGAPQEIADAAARGELDPAAAKWLHSLGQKFGKEGAEMLNQGGERRLTRTEAESQLDEIYANPAHAYHDPSHPDHRRAVKRVLELGAARHGRKAPSIEGY